MRWVRAARALVRELREAAGRRLVREDLQRRHSGVRIARGVEIRSPERLQLGAGVMIDAGVLLHCGGMDWSGGSGGIEIGDDGYVGPGSVLFGAGGIRIGQRVLISPGVVLTSHQHSFDGREPIREQPTRFAPIHIDDDVWVGAHATVLPGVHLGAGCIIGAGAVVTRDIPPGAVAMGVPARVVRTR